MKEVRKIVVKEDSDFWKSIKEAANLDAEKAAEKAAEQARKETLARAEKRATEHKAYLDSIKNYDKLDFKNGAKRARIEDSVKNRLALQKQVNEEYAIQSRLEAEIQESCAHEMVLERRSSYRDEYDTWHDGPKERKCIECFLTEQEKHYEEKPFNNLSKSKVIFLRRIIDDKEYELEFEDLKW